MCCGYTLGDTPQFGWKPKGEHCWPLSTPPSSGGSGSKELGCTKRKGATFPPWPIPHGHFRKHSGFSWWLRRRGQGWVQTSLCSFGGYRAALNWEGERPAEGLAENRSPIRGTFKFLLSERRYLRSVLTEWVFYV